VASRSPSSSPPSSKERQPLSFLAAAAWSIGAYLAFTFVVVMTEAARPGAQVDLVNVTACYALTYSLVIFVMLRIYEPETRVRRVLAFRGCSVFGAILATIAGAALNPPLTLVGSLITKRFPMGDDEKDLLDRLLHTDSLGSRIVLLVSVVLVAPLCEQLFFNGVIYGGLRRGRVSSLAVTGTAIFFATSSADLRDLPLLLPLGLVLTWFRSRSGSIVPAMLAHVAFLTVPLAPIAIGRPEIEAFPLPWTVGGAALAFVCAITAGFVFKRSEASLTARLEDG
jgi:membrane protease YdiL (CAAX protease family)